MNPKYMSEERKSPAGYSPNTVGGHRGVFVGSTRGDTSPGLTYVDTGAPLQSIPKVFNPGITPVAVPKNVTPKSEETFIQKYKKPLLIGGGILLVAGAIYLYKK